MTLVYTKRIKKIISFGITVKIFGLILCLLLPWICVTNTSSSTTETIYYGLSAIENMNDEQIKIIAADIGLINICFWIMIIFGLISSIGMMLLTTGKKSQLARILVLSGCTNIIFSILVIIANLGVIQKIEDTSTISLAPVLGLSFTTVGYGHLSLITGVVSLLTSLAYSGLTVLYVIKSSNYKKKQTYDWKSIEKKENEQVVIKKSSLEKKKEVAKRIQPIEKQLEPKEKIPLKATIRQEYYADKDRTQTIIEDEKETTREQPAAPFVAEIPSEVKKEIYEKPFADEQTKKPEITPETNQEKTQSSDVPQMANLFEKALSSALEKRQPEIKKEKVEQKQPEIKQPENKKISVRCPECKNIFTVEKGEFETKIECPHCGTKGTIKH